MRLLVASRLKDTVGLAPTIEAVSKGWSDPHFEASHLALVVWDLALVASYLALMALDLALVVAVLALVVWDLALVALDLEKPSEA